MKLSLRTMEGGLDIRIWRVLLVILVVGCIAVPSLRNSIFSAAQVGYENTMLMIDPSGARAYEYGNVHFDATHPRDYDLVRAEKLYQQALRADPEQPYVHHQLARIAFLKGDQTQALVHINESIARDDDPSSYYVRGLIKGFVGDYAGAAQDYETFLHDKPTSWAGINDYAWILLKADRPEDALIALDWGILHNPENAWLYNNKATAHYELGQYDMAYDAATTARTLAEKISERQWLRAYPGNDPLIAQEGIAALKQSIESNIHTISLAQETAPVDVR